MSDAVTLLPIGRGADDLRFFIRLDGRHAGGITLHSVSAPSFSYGIAVKPGMRVAVVDDLLATGGTALAACRMAEQLGGKVVAVRFCIELEGMSGRDKLKDYDVQALMTFPGD